MAIRRWWFIIILLSVSAIRVFLFCSNVGCSREERLNFEKSNQAEPGHSGFIQKYLDVFRKDVTEKVYSFLPSPHSELLLGMVLGIDNLKMVPAFKDSLKNSGTIHVVVVSGFNISLIFDLVIGVIGTRYRLRNLILAEVVTLLYAIVAGFEPPVVRAFIMGSVASWGKYYGRLIDTIQILLFSGGTMVVINPLYFFSLSFQLSFLATLSLLMFSDFSGKFTGWVFGERLKSSFLAQDFSTSVSAQILVWPFIAYHFGRVSILSPVINSLVLWSVPSATVLGIMFLVLAYFVPVSLLLFRWVVYVPLDIFVKAVDLFGNWKFSSFAFEPGSGFVIYYYLIVFVVWLLLGRGAHKT